MGGCNVRNILPIKVPKYNGGEIQVFDKKLLKSTSTYNLEHGLYTSITDIVEALNTLNQESNNHNKTCITVNVSRRSQKVLIILANDTSGLAFCSTDWGHIFGKDVGNQFGVLMKGKGPQEPQFGYDIVRIHSLMIYSDIVEYNKVGDTKAPLLQCFLFISKLKRGDIITTGQYMNYQTFSNLQFKPLLKNSFHSIHIDLRARLVKNYTLYLPVSLASFGCLERCPTFSSNTYGTTRWFASRQVEIPYYRGVGRQRGREFCAFAQVIGRTAIPLLCKYVVPAAKCIGAGMLEFPAP